MFVLLYTMSYIFQTYIYIWSVYVLRWLQAGIGKVSFKPFLQELQNAASRIDLMKRPVASRKMQLDMAVGNIVNHIGSLENVTVVIYIYKLNTKLPGAFSKLSSSVSSDTISPSFHDSFFLFVCLLRERVLRRGLCQCGIKLLQC